MTSPISLIFYAECESVAASHNPKDDNGYKVYWSNGVQIIPPHDIGIARTIESNLEVEERAWDVGLQDELQNGAGVGEGSSQDVTEELGKAYSEMVARMCTNRLVARALSLCLISPCGELSRPFSSFRAGRVVHHIPTDLPTNMSLSLPLQSGEGAGPRGTESPPNFQLSLGIGVVVRGHTSTSQAQSAFRVRRRDL